MNRTKKIYFLAAFVLIIGCYVLNLSYSLFVQTEEKQIVDETVPNLAYNLSIDNGVQDSDSNLKYSITVPKGTSQIVTLKVNNTGSADISYGIKLLETLTEYQKVQVVDGDDNDIIGTVEGQSTKEVQLYIEDTEEVDETFTLTFELIANYTTLNLAYEVDTQIIREPKYKERILSEEIIDSAILAASKSDATRTVFVEPSNLPTDPLTSASGSSEHLLSYISDENTVDGDENTYAYYYRGNVVDNYVNFNDMCWRIIRRNGNGTVKLVLAAQKSCESITSSDTNSAFIGSGNYGYAYGYNEYFYNSTQGSTYTVYANDYFGVKDVYPVGLVGTEVSFVGGGMRSALIKWFGTYFTEETYINYLDYTLQAENEVYEDEYFYDYVAPLIKEDVLYAGLNSVSNADSYLTANSSGLWWTYTIEKTMYRFYYSLDPDMEFWSYESYGDYVYTIDANKITSQLVNQSLNYRPSITLLSTAKISSGDGTQSNPYVVE